jgi:hypothetical protein
MVLAGKFTEGSLDIFRGRIPGYPQDLVKIAITHASTETGAG